MADQTKILLERLRNIRSLEGKTEFRSGGLNGTFSAGVSVEEPDDRTIVFRERGVWQGGDGMVLNTSNVYRWELTGDGSLHVGHLRYGADTPVLLAQLVAVDNETFTAPAPHQCSADLYLPRLSVTDDAIELHWSVTGPQKDGTILSRYM